MSLELHAQAGALEDAEAEPDFDSPWAETVVTAAGVVIAIGIVSWMAMLMYLA